MPGQAMPTNTKDQAKTMPGLQFWNGAPSGFRTPDPLIKSQLLYQLS